MNTMSHASDNESPIISVKETNLVETCLSFTIKNNQDKTVYLAKWDVMQAGELTKDVFTIESKAGTQFTYKGKLVKRSEPTIDDLVAIKPGQIHAMKVDLSEYYDLQGEIYKVIYDATVPVYDVSNDVIQVVDFESIESIMFNKNDS